MTIKREVIAEGVILSTHNERPGHLCITTHDADLVPRIRVLTPEEVDKLVLSALSMTKPEDLGGYVDADYHNAVEAVRRWHQTKAQILTRRQRDAERDAERDAVMKEAGYRTLTYTKAGPAIQTLVDKLIEARKAGQK